jgi:GDP-L-fucose synthase
MERYSGDDIVNIGTGEDIAIGDLARLVAETVGFRGRVEFDATKPDGTPRKVLDVSRLSALGWRARVALPDGVAAVYRGVDKSGWLEG